LRNSSGHKLLSICVTGCDSVPAPIPVSLSLSLSLFLSVSLSVLLLLPHISRRNPMKRMLYWLNGADEEQETACGHHRPRPRPPEDSKVYRNEKGQFNLICRSGQPERICAKCQRTATIIHTCGHIQYYICLPFPSPLICGDSLGANLNLWPLITPMINFISNYDCEIMLPEFYNPTGKQGEFAFFP